MSQSPVTTLQAWAVIKPDGHINTTSFLTEYFCLIPHRYGMTEDIAFGMVFCFPSARKKEGWRIKLVDVTVALAT